MSRTDKVIRLESSELTVSIEGGGTHSKAALYRNTEEAAQVTVAAGPCNPSTNLELALVSVKQLFDQITEQIGSLVPAKIRIVAGCAGLVPLDVRREFLKRAFAEFGSVYAMSDGYASLVGAGRGDPCGMIVSGTGCAGHRLCSDGRSIQRDGWGWLGGDRGSGFWIGLRAIRYAMAMRDEVCPADLLGKRVLETLGNQDHELSAALAKLQPRVVASLTKTVFECEDEGSSIASDILDRAAEHLRQLFASLGCEAGEKLYLSGSVARSLHDRISVGMEVKPQLPEQGGLKGCHLVSCGKAPLEWGDDPATKY